MRRSSRTSTARACLVAASLFLSHGAARAQAWLPPEGEAWVTLGYGNVYSNRHYLGTAQNPGDSVQNDFGHIRSQSVGVQFGYGITDRFTLSFGIPFVDSKYEYVGAPCFRGPGRCGHNGGNIAPDQRYIDDGLYHGTFQDFTLGLRYQALRGPVALALLAGAVIPSHSYTYFAHSAAGRDLHEYLLGLSAGSRLDSILPGSYVEATYSYSFVERVLGIYHDRSDFLVELGYFFTPSLSLRGVGTGTYTHGGITFSYDTQLTAVDLRIHHDQITHSEGILLGGGPTYALTGNIELYAAYMTQVLGRSGHKINQALSFGVSYGFSPKQLIRRYVSPPRPGPGTTLP